MECGEDEESDSDVDNTFLEERIWDDLEYNEENAVDRILAVMKLLILRMTLAIVMSSRVLEGVVNVVQLEHEQDM